MQELLKKIIEMDEQARKVEKEAKSEKLKSEAEVEQLREQIYNDYITRAKARVEKNIAVDEARADERIAAYRDKTEAAKRELQEAYERDGDSWVSEIVDRALSQ